MIDTRQNIIQTAIRLFNERGVVNVRVRDIGEEMDISVGNITYHFKTKQDIIDSVYRFMIKTLEEMSIGNQLVAAKKDQFDVVKGYLEYITQFRFFYQDTLEIIRSYPNLAKLHHQQVEQEKNIILSLIYLGVGKGELISEPTEGIYHSLAHSIWMTLHFWLTQQAIRGEENDNLEMGLMTIANLLFPFATEKGKQVFNKRKIELLASVN